MKLNVKTKLETILKYPFFQSVGQHLPSSVSSVNSWQVALKHSSSTKWRNCTLMAKNAFANLVDRRSWERGQLWNPMAQELRPTINSFVETSLAKTPVPEQFIGEIKYNVRWDI